MVAGILEDLPYIDPWAAAPDDKTKKPTPKRPRSAQDAMRERNGSVTLEE